jgi:hypothetical protein
LSGGKIRVTGNNYRREPKNRTGRPRCHGF